MKEWIKKHKKIAACAAALIILLVAAAAWHRGQVLSNVAYDDAPDEKRGEAPAQNTYYTDQLTQKEYKAYTLMLERLDDFAGGVVVFPEPLSPMIQIALLIRKPPSIAAGTTSFPQTASRNIFEFNPKLLRCFSCARPFGNICTV